MQAQQQYARFVAKQLFMSMPFGPPEQEAHLKVLRTFLKFTAQDEQELDSRRPRRAWVGWGT